MKALRNGFSGDTADDPENLRPLRNRGPRKAPTAWGRGGPPVGTLVTIKGDAATACCEDKIVVLHRGQIMLVVDKVPPGTKSGETLSVIVICEGRRHEVRVVFLKEVTP